MGKSLKSLAVVVVASAVALAFAWFAGVNSVEIYGFNAMFVIALVALGVNWLAFIPSAIAEADTYYDTIGAVTYLTTTALAVYAAISASGSLDLRGWVIAAMVALWCIRLGSFLFIRIHAMGGADSRFEKIKTKPARFLVAWTLQALWVILTASAAHAAITVSERVEIGVFFWVGAVIWAIGMFWETVADAQKSKFKADPDNKGDFIDVGLWKWSRHPNYFGDACVWWGIWIASASAGWWVAAWTIAGPIFLTFTLTKWSGAALLESGMKSSRPGYEEYKARTSAFIPWPPKKSAS